VIDVLRATTTIVQALASGAECVMPFASVEEALAAAEEVEPTPLLCGERYGFKVDGFDLGNSPAEYTPSAVGGLKLAMSTTNGTRAMSYCREAGRILIGAFTNLSAVCGELAGLELVHLVCAGTNNQVTREDALLAGAILANVPGAEADGSGAELALTAWQRIDPANLATELVSTTGGQNLIKIEMGGDLEWAAKIDQFAIIPIFDPRSGMIRVG
jgi:2-phosphosulfolactate phosphatase